LINVSAECIDPQYRWFVHISGLWHNIGRATAYGVDLMVGQVLQVGDIASPHMWWLGRYYRLVTLPPPTCDGWAGITGWWHCLISHVNVTH
jgi:hypothetical protein